MTESLPERPSGGLSLSWIIVLVAVGAGYRVAVPLFGLPWNSSPLMAMAFGGGLLLGARSFWIPALMLLASDIVLGFLFPGEGVASYTAVSVLFYLVVAWMGARVGREVSVWPAMWCGTLLSGVLFYLVANTYTWAVLPEYVKSVEGWWQSQTTGLPGFPPAWTFLRNSLIADSLWCGLAGIVYVAFRQTRPSAVQMASVR